MQKTFYLLFTAILLVSACKVQQYTPATYPDKQITIGNGGGFSGQVTEYTVLENGQVFVKKPTSKEFLEVKKLEKNVVSQLFHNYSVLNLGAVDLKQSGNMYSYITYNSGSKEHKMMWGDGDAPVANVKLFHNIIKSLVKPQAETK